MEKPKEPKETNRYNNIKNINRYKEYCEINYKIQNKDRNNIIGNEIADDCNRFFGHQILKLKGYYNGQNS